MPPPRGAADRRVNETPPLVLVVDDDEDVRRSLSRLLRAEGYAVLAWGSAEDFLRDALPDRAACLLLDLRLPDVDGLGLLAAVRRQATPPPIVFLTGHGDIRTSVRAIRAGAFDFLEKPVEADRLVASVARAVTHDRETRAQRLAEADARARLDSLTPREREVCRLVAAGLANKAIASRLGIGVKTVKVHRGRVFQKLSVASLADLVRLVERLHPTSSTEASGEEPS